MVKSSSDDSSDDMFALRPASEHLYAPLDKDNRKMLNVSTAEFIGTLVLIPIWAFAIAPLAVVWQAGMLVLNGISGPAASLPKIDSGYVAKDLLPRPDRKYDVVLLGATGFTGKLCTRHMIKTYSLNKNKQQVKWAIAGRSQSKLDQVKQDVVNELLSKYGDNVDKQALLDSIDTILVDTTVPSMIPNLVRNTRAVVSTAGPFFLYSSHVVEFCAKFGTHYVDISAETDWFRTMMVKWESTAQKTGARLLSLCGNDSVPWDLTVMRMDSAMKEHGLEGEELVSITCFDDITGGISGGTLYTASLLINGQSLPRPTPDPFLKTMQGTISPAKTSNDLFSFLVLPTQVPWRPKQGHWKMPFVMAVVNHEAISWSQALRGAPTPVLYSESSIAPNFQTAFTVGFGLLAGLTAILNPITGYILKNFVFPKPGQGPDLKEMAEVNYMAIYGKAVGSKGSEFESIIYFSGDAGYLETARMVSEAGLAMALEEDKLLAKEGGFYTPAAALGDVFLKRLMKTGTHFAMKKMK